MPQQATLIEGGFHNFLLLYFQNGNLYILCYYREAKDGVYGVTVNTGVCGALDSGSIPDRHPRSKYLLQGGFCVVGV